MIGVIQTFGRKIWERQGIAIAFLVSLLLVVGGWVWVYLRLRGLNTPLILHFSNFSGIDRIGSLPDLMADGFFGVAIVLVNAMVGLALEPRDRFLSILTASATFAMSCLLFILFAVIISVN